MQARLFETLLLTGTLAAGWACFAGQEPDISEDLQRARKAWEEGDALGRKAPGDFQLLEKQEQAYDRAEKTFRAALKKDPKHPLALAELGRFFVARKLYAQARTWLEAAQASPRASTLSATNLAEIHRLLGGLLERGGEITPALDRYKRAVQADPTDARNVISYAVALCADGQPEQAAEALKPWAAQNQSAKPAQPAERAFLALGYYTYGVALEEAGFLEEAHQQYTRAHELARGAGAADVSEVADHAVMALTRLEELFDGWNSRAAERAKENEARKEKKLPPLPDEREDYAKACYRCDEGVRLKNLALADASFNAALLLVRNGENNGSAAAGIEKHPAFDSFLAAMQAFQDAISKSPRLPRAHYQLALCNLLLGRFGKARGLLDAAAVYSPNDLAILHLQGTVLLELGQWPDAATTFKKILLLEPESGRANLGLARAYAGSQSDERQCQAALDALDRASQLGVRDPRIFSRQVVQLMDGREIEGDVREEAGNYIVQGSSPQALEIPKSEVKEITRRAGLRDQLVELQARFERGEKPATGPVLRGSSQPKTPRPGPAPNPWSGTILEN